MVQCNIDIEDGDQVDDHSEIDVNKSGGFHLNPSHPDKESDTGSMMSKHKIDLMFSINKKDGKGKRIDDNTERDNMKIENKVQEKIDEMFKEVALNDMIKNFHVDYLGSIQIDNEKIQSLESLQEPLKKLYVLYKKDRQLKINNNKSILKITKNGLKLNYGNQLEQINSFNTICVWASVKLITRPHGINKKFGLEYCFLPLISDYKNNENIKFIKLNQNETYLFPNNNTYQDNVPIFVIVMKKIKLLEVHAFICNSNEDAINIAANLYKTLLLTNKNNNKIKQKNGITSCVSVNESHKGSNSKNSHVMKAKSSSVGSINRKYSAENGLKFDRKSTNGSIQEATSTTQNGVSKHERENNITSRSDFEKRLIKEHDRIERYSESSRCSRQDRNNGRMNKTPNGRSSSVESVRNYVVDPYRRKAKQREAENYRSHLGEKSGSVESVRHYVDYVSEAIKNRKTSIISSEVSSRKHRSNSVESVKDYDIQGNHRKKYSDNMNRHNSVESISHGHHGSRRKDSRASSESLRKKLRANSVESILNYNKMSEYGRQQMDPCPELPLPKRKSSNNSTKSINLQSIDFFKNLQLSNAIFHAPNSKQKATHEMEVGSRRHSSDNAHITISGINSKDYNENKMDNTQRRISRSRSSSINYVHTSTSGIHSMTEFDVRDINMKGNYSTNHSSRRAHGKNNEQRRKDSFTNETIARKIKNREDGKLDEIEICNTNKSGDILTRVAIPRSTSFLKTNSSLRNSLNYSIKNYDARKLSSCKLGLNDLFLELKNQEGLNNLDEILNVIINSDGMSFNELKPIYKEFIIKLALILTKDEFYEKCKLIMSKQNKRKKNFNRKTNKKVLNKIIYSKFNKDVNHLFLCGKKKILRKTSICKNSLKRKIAPYQHKVKRKQKMKTKEDKNLLLSNDMNTSSGYFTYSECTYDTDSCTCKSADKCYCTRTLSQLGGTSSPEHDMYYKQKNMKKTFINKVSKKQNCLNNKKKSKQSLYPTNSYKYQNKRNYKDVQDRRTFGYEETERHCYHCSKYKSVHSHSGIYQTNIINDGTLEICDCDTESCRDSDKCYCNVNNINVLDMLKLQGFAASDSSIDSSFQSNDESFPIKQNWKRNLLNKYKDKQYIQASKSLEFVQFTNSDNGINGNQPHADAQSDRYDEPSISSFSYKDVGGSSESSILDYNLFNQSKQGQNQQRNDHRNYPENQRSHFENPNKFLVVSARDPKGRIVYVGADKNHCSKKKKDTKGQSDVISIKKSAEIASLFMKKQHMTSDIDFNDADTGIKKINKLENSLGYLP